MQSYFDLLSGGGVISSSSSRLQFEAFSSTNPQGITFAADGDAITLSLYIDGKLDNTKIFYGSANQNPGNACFSLVNTKPIQSVFWTEKTRTADMRRTIVSCDNDRFRPGRFGFSRIEKDINVSSCIHVQNVNVAPSLFIHWIKCRVRTVPRIRQHSISTWIKMATSMYWSVLQWQFCYLHTVYK